jgi:glycosyltransferase involved in cell wall biosynthesis
MRAINLTNALIADGHKVVLWTSDFDHLTKAHRFGSGKKIDYSGNLEINFISSIGYQSNKGVRRLFDHIQLGLNLWFRIRKEAPPDVAFIGYPPIEPAWAMVKWLQNKNVPTVLDVKDAWPDVMLRAFPRQFRKFASPLLYPHKLLMKSTFSSAGYLSSISQPFLQWALDSAGRSKKPLDSVNFLSTIVENVDHGKIQRAEKFWDLLGIGEDSRLICSYIGSLTVSLNFEPVLHAAKNSNFIFVIAGDGPLLPELKMAAKEIDNIIFPGWVDQSQAIVLARRSTLLIAPYADLDDFAISLPNKFLDAMSLSKPMLTSIGGYAGNLIELMQIGDTYSNSDLGNLLEKLKKYFDSEEEVGQMGNRAGDLFRSEFDGNIVYGNLVKNLEKISQSKD